MIGIGLMGFLLAGVALLLSTLNLWDQGLRYASELTQGPQLVFENRATLPAADTHRAVIYRSNPNHPVILSGLPAYQGVAFTMPTDARPTSGYLQIDATLQVLKGVEGVLRISIDNARRGEMLLRPGEVGRSLQIPLSPTEVARNQLVVSFSLQGEGPGAQCSTDAGFEAVVEIETTSAIFLTLDRPLSTPRDRVNAWGHMLRVAWPNWLKPEERTRRLILATQARQRGIQTAMVDAHSGDALTTDALRAVLPDLPDANHAGLSAWPKPLAQTGTNAGLRRFHRQTIWRQRYDISQDPELRVARALDLRLALGRHPMAAPWSLTVTLNNRLVHQQAVEASQTELALSVALPKEMQSAVNMIEVTLRATDQHNGPCADRPERIAEMLPGTQLLPGHERYADPVTALRATLAAISTLRIGLHSDLTAADAQTASTMLAKFLPATTTLKPDTNAAQIIVLSPQAGPIPLPSSGPIWLVTTDTTSRNLIAQPLDATVTFRPTDVALLVLPSPLSASERTQ